MFQQLEAFVLELTRATALKTNNCRLVTVVTLAGLDQAYNPAKKQPQQHASSTAQQ